MKSLTEYIKEQLEIGESLASAIERKMVIRLMDDETRKAWDDAVRLSKTNYSSNKEIALHDEKEKRKFIAWLNDSIYNRPFNLQVAAPGVYELFYLPGEKVDAYNSEIAKKLLDVFYGRCEKCDTVNIETCDCAVSNENLNEAKSKFMNAAQLKDAKTVYKYSTVIKYRLKEFEFIKLLDKILLFAYDTATEDKIKDTSLSYNTRYSLLADSLADWMDSCGIYDSDEAYIDIFEELMVFFTIYYGLEG